MRCFPKTPSTGRSFSFVLSSPVAAPTGPLPIVSEVGHGRAQVTPCVMPQRRHLPSIVCRQTIYQTGMLAAALMRVLFSGPGSRLSFALSWPRGFFSSSCCSHTTAHPLSFVFISRAAPVSVCPPFNSFALISIDLLHFTIVETGTSPTPSFLPTTHTFDCRSRTFS